VISRLGNDQPAGTVRVAVAQTAPQLGANLDQIIARLEEAAVEGARLAVFPECALSGYLLDDLEELERYAEPVPGPAIRRLAETCTRMQVHTVVGLLERGADALYNSAVLVGPSGLIACYRKAHLPGLGLDRLVAHGDTPFAVHETRSAASVWLSAMTSGFQSRCACSPCKVPISSRSLPIGPW
jgi:predicted amidohydrolase